MNEITCTGCGAQVHPLAIFPNDLCLECYKVTPEANRPITATELARMWGAR